MIKIDKRNPYKRIYVDGKIVRVHRWKMEKHLKRKLLRTEIVHHKNGNILDNRLVNLELLTRDEHEVMHNRKA